MTLETVAAAEGPLQNGPGSNEVKQLLKGETNLAMGPLGQRGDVSISLCQGGLVRKVVLSAGNVFGVDPHPVFGEPVFGWRLGKKLRALLRSTNDEP